MIPASAQKAQANRLKQGPLSGTRAFATGSIEQSGRRIERTDHDRRWFGERRVQPADTASSCNQLGMRVSPPDREACWIHLQTVRDVRAKRPPMSSTTTSVRPPSDGTLYRSHRSRVAAVDDDSDRCMRWEANVFGLTVFTADARIENQNQPRARNGLRVSLSSILRGRFLHRCPSDPKLASPTAGQFERAIGRYEV